jgi:hypothetical protein
LPPLRLGRTSQCCRASISGCCSAALRAMASSRVIAASSYSHRRWFRQLWRSSVVSSTTAIAPTRKRARLHYLIERWGIERCLTEAAAHMPYAWRLAPLEICKPSSLSDWSLADRGMERRFALRCVNRRRDAERVGGLVEGSGINPSRFG